MTTLPFDYARCMGTTSPVCAGCRRREPGRWERQAYILPQLDMMTGRCPMRIEPLPQRVTTNTAAP